MSTDDSQARQRGERTDSSIKRLPGGKGWRARPTLGTDPVTGKQVRPTKVFRTKGEAAQWAIEQRQQWGSATWAPKSSQTFDEVADHWLKLREADPSIGPNTVRADRESLAYTRRAFGAVPVQRLTPAALADWSATLTGRGGKALAPATKRRAIVRLKSVMVHAKRTRWLTYDPSADLTAPEQKAVTATAADDIWAPEQMGKFLDHVAAHRLAGCYALTLLGLRREEVGGLRWSDLDLETGALRIRRARVDVNGRDMIVPTKTNRSARDLPVPQRELAMIKAMRSVHLRERLAVGRPLADADLLLSRADGHAATGARLQPGVRSPAQGGGPQGDHARKAATLQHLSDACGRHCRRCGGRLARPYRADDTGGVRKGHRRSDHRRCGGVLASGKPGLGNLDPARAFG